MIRRHLIVSYCLLAATTPFAIWGLLPDVSEAGGTDHLIEPVVADGTRVIVGFCAAVVLLVTLVVVLSPAGRRLRRNGDVGVVIPLVVAGVYAAVVYRIASSAASGANIGGALLLYVGVALVPGLVFAAAFSAWRMSRPRRA